MVMVSYLSFNPRKIDIASSTVGSSIILSGNGVPVLYLFQKFLVFIQRGGTDRS
jgi:uncharacterized membrane protein required for colicin V production